MTSARAPGHFNMFEHGSETMNQLRHTKRDLSSKASALAQSKVSANIKSRKRVNTAEKRASHNAIERQRRELLNTRFLDLARLLPSLASVRRPSKSAIVNGSINHLGLSRSHRLSAARELRRMFAEKQELLEEVNEWRNRNGLSIRTTTGWTRDMEDILSVESEVFGDFTSMGNGDVDDLDGDDERDVQHGDHNQSAPARNLVHSHQSLRLSLDGNGHQYGQPQLQQSSYGSSANEMYSRSSHQSSIVASEPVSSAAFAMVANQKSFAPTETSSAISGSPSYVHQAYVGGQASPIGTGQHYALQTFLAQGEAVATDHSHHSPGGLSGDCITPPSHEVHIEVNTFAPSSPPVAPTSFAQVGTDQEKVSQWAAQQVMLQYVPERSYQGNTSPSKRSSADVNFVNPFDPNAERSASAMSQHQHPGSSLGAAHQALLTNQPQLAAAVFPPPYAENIYPSTNNVRADKISFGAPGPAGFVGQAQLQQYLAVNSATPASGVRPNEGMSYSQIEQWSRFGHMSSGLPAGTIGESMADFGHVSHPGISVGLASGLRRNG